MINYLALVFTLSIVACGEAIVLGPLLDPTPTPTPNPTSTPNQKQKDNIQPKILSTVPSTSNSVDPTNTLSLT